jgi:hypothetical protein
MHLGADLRCHVAPGDGAPRGLLLAPTTLGESLVIPTVTFERRRPDGFLPTLLRLHEIGHHFNPGTFVLGDLLGWVYGSRALTFSDVTCVLDVHLPASVSLVILNDVASLETWQLRRFDVLHWSRAPSCWERASLLKRIDSQRFRHLQPPRTAAESLCAWHPELRLRRRHSDAVSYRHAVQWACALTAADALELALFQRWHPPDVARWAPRWCASARESMDSPPGDRSTSTVAAQLQDLTLVRDVVLLDRRSKADRVLVSSGVRRLSMTMRQFEEWSMPQAAPWWWRWVARLHLFARRCWPCLRAATVAGGGTAPLVLRLQAPESTAGRRRSVSARREPLRQTSV